MEEMPVEEGVELMLLLGLAMRVLVVVVVVVQPTLLMVSLTKSVELEEQRRPLRRGLPACWQG